MAQVSAQTKTSAQAIERAETARPRRWFRPINILIYALLAFFTFSSLGPFIYSLLSSFKPEQEVLAFPPSLFPIHWTIGNYFDLLKSGTFTRYLFNSLVFAVGVSFLNVLFSAMAGYALSRMEFPGRNLVFVTTLAVMMIPNPITIIPKFLVMSSVGLLNTYWALILPYAAQPFSVFLMVQFMKGLPKELEESARIDGASRWRTFYQIILPLVKPALTAVTILSFQGAWNEFLWSLLVLNSDNMYTLPVGLFQFKSAHFTQYALLISGSMFNAIPILILFFIFQRYFIEGAVGSGVKG
ncbi:MAG: carbohydrate ABC transporter permease [Ktedonobacteraceae bacterium]